MVFDGEAIMSDGRRLLARVIMDETSEGLVHLAMMTSADAGNRWDDVLDAKLRPQRQRRGGQRPAE
jgi:hypothetical protein